MKKTVLINLKDKEAFSKFDNYNCIFGDKFSKEQLSVASIVIGNIPDNDLLLCKNLEWIQLSSAGVSPFVNEFAKKNNIKVTNSSGAYGLAVAEFMFASTLSMLKNLNQYTNFQNEKVWKSAGSVKSFYDATVLILGAGDIGIEYAKRAKAFGSYVIGVKRNVTSTMEYFDELHTLDQLQDLIPEADIVFNVLPSTASTKGIITKELIYKMKKTAIFVNGGRGDVVCQEDLIDALNNEVIAGACLDVFVNEPLENNTDIWSTKNLFITPHAAGGFSLAETYKRIVKLSVKNFESFDQEKEFNRSVDLTQGY